MKQGKSASRSLSVGDRVCESSACFGCAQSGARASCPQNVESFFNAETQRRRNFYGASLAQTVALEGECPHEPPSAHKKLNAQRSTLNFQRSSGWHMPPQARRLPISALRNETRKPSFRIAEGGSWGHSPSKSCQSGQLCQSGQKINPQRGNLRINLLQDTLLRARTPAPDSLLPFSPETHDLRTLLVTNRLHFQLSTLFQG